MATESTNSGTENQEPSEQGDTVAKAERDDAASQSQGANGGGDEDASGVRRVVTTGAAAGAVAAAVGAAVMAGRRALASREGSEGEESGGSSTGAQTSTPDVTGKAREVVDQARKRGESISPTVKAAGLEIMKQNLIPLAETAAATAGSFAATSAPDFVRDRIVPKFIDSFNKERNK